MKNELQHLWHGDMIINAIVTH